MKKYLGFYIFLLLIFACRTEYQVVKNEMLPQIDTGICVVVYGDTRDGHAIHKKIVQRIEKNKPLAVFHTGDLVNNGNIQSQWDTFNLITSEMRRKFPFYPTLGNHEKNSELFYKNFDLPNNEQFYLVKIKENMFFVVLNSCEEMKKDSEQYRFLEKTLSEIKLEKAFIAVIFHQPIFSTGAHGNMSEPQKSELIALFEKYKVDAIFNGHDHQYERTFFNGIHYVVAGGGGAPLRGRFSKNKNSLVFLKKYNFCRIYLVENRWVIDIQDENGILIDKFNTK